MNNMYKRGIARGRIEFPRPRRKDLIIPLPDICQHEIRILTQREARAKLVPPVTSATEREQCPATPQALCT